MLQTIITALIILSALASSSWLSRRAPERCRAILSLTLSYTPLDVLALLCVIYWLSFFTTGSTYAAAKDMRL